MVILSYYACANTGCMDIDIDAHDMFLARLMHLALWTRYPSSYWE